jgi:hypothetical protein
MIVTQTHPEKRVQNKVAVSMNPISSAVPKVCLKASPQIILIMGEYIEVQDQVILRHLFARD